MDDVERIVTICKDIKCKGYEKAEIHKSDFWYIHIHTLISLACTLLEWD
jgi:hypothetical protein